ncbi:hypothetical protein [Bradyrhizobium sp.]|jgi:hypothetical protein|uniref:hypothetical protein n=1 Tax=Bradyrhizobium sp. TaxID=376 RepID=UPI003D10E7D5
MAKVTAANARHVTSGKTFDASSAETADAALVNASRARSSEAAHVSSDASSAEISDVALVSTTRAGCSEATYVSCDVTSAKTTHVTSASACLCSSSKKAAGKRSTC